MCSLERCNWLADELSEWAHISISRFDLNWFFIDILSEWRSAARTLVEALCGVDNGTSGPEEVKRKNRVRARERTSGVNESDQVGVRKVAPQLTLNRFARTKAPSEPLHKSSSAECIKANLGQKKKQTHRVCIERFGGSHCECVCCHCEPR